MTLTFRKDFCQFASGAVAAAAIGLLSLPAARAQTTIYSDSFDDASSGGTRTSRNLTTVPGAVPFYLSTAATSASTALTTTNAIAGTGSLSIASGVGVAAPIGTLDFSQVGQSYTLNATFQFPTGTPAQSTVRLGFINATGDTSDQAESTTSFTSFFSRFATTTTSPTGSNYDAALVEPSGTGATFLGGSTITGPNASYTSSTVNNFVANAFTGGNLANNIVRYQITITRTSTGVVETDQYAPGATGGSYTTNLAYTFTGTTPTTFNGIGILNTGAGVNLLVDNVTVTSNPASAPEPGSLAILLASAPLGAVTLYARRRRA